MSPPPKKKDTGLILFATSNDHPNSSARQVPSISLYATFFKPWCIQQRLIHQTIGPSLARSTVYDHLDCSCRKTGAIEIIVMDNSQTWFDICKDRLEEFDGWFRMKDLWLMIQDSSPTTLWDLDPLRSTIADWSTTPAWKHGSVARYQQTQLICFLKFSISAIKCSAWQCWDICRRQTKWKGWRWQICCFFLCWIINFCMKRTVSSCFGKVNLCCTSVPLLVIWTVFNTQWRSVFVQFIGFPEIHYAMLLARFSTHYINLVVDNIRIPDQVAINYPPQHKKLWT